jgi:hypothetical protein
MAQALKLKTSSSLSLSEYINKMSDLISVMSDRGRHDIAHQDALENRTPILQIYNTNSGVYNQEITTNTVFASLHSYLKPHNHGVNTDFVVFVQVCHSFLIIDD